MDAEAADFGFFQGSRRRGVAGLGWVERPPRILPAQRQAAGGGVQAEVYRQGGVGLAVAGDVGDGFFQAELPGEDHRGVQADLVALGQFGFLGFFGWLGPPPPAPPHEGEGRGKQGCRVGWHCTAALGDSTSREAKRPCYVVVKPKQRRRAKLHCTLRCRSGAAPAASAGRRMKLE
jgi:hypothetical protein